MCTSKSSTTTYGTCQTSSECETAGGSADGNCAAGFGVCCKFFFNRKICIFNFFVFFLKMLFFCVTRCSCHNHMWKRHFYKHHIHQKRRVCLVICSKKDFQSPFLRYPSTYTPTTTGSCAFTVNKVQDDICQLRLDFQTFTGLAASTTAGSCTDSIAVAGNNLTTIKRHKVKF